MAEGRSALIVAVSEYQDAGLRQLVAPAQDAEALARVLGDPAIGGFAVQTLLNQPSHQVNREIEAFFANRARDDLLLLYFSGHDLKDEEGRLYFATPDTDRKFLRTTAVAATLINEVMHHSRSRRQVLILDCCYSGAFARGMTHRANGTVGAGEYFREGRGQFVLTASDALQYAFEGDAVSGEGVRSVFTHTLVRGLETGEADLDGDSTISCDELYDYLHERIADRVPEQKPRKWAFAVEGDIIIARNPHPVVKPVALPAELQQSIEDPRPWVREGAARHLGELLQHGNKGLAAAAQAVLHQMKEDDSLKVRAVVVEILKAPAEKEAEAARQAEEARRQAEAARQAEEARKAEEVQRQAEAAHKTKALPTLPAISRKLPVLPLVAILVGSLYYIWQRGVEKAPIQQSPELETRSSTPSPAVKSSSLPPTQTIDGWSAQQVRNLQQQTAQALKTSVEFRDTLKDGGQGPAMVVIPGGRFQMGSPPDEQGRRPAPRGCVPPPATGSRPPTATASSACVSPGP